MFDDPNALFTDTRQTDRQSSSTAASIEMTNQEYRQLQDEWLEKIQAAAPSFLRKLISPANQ